MDEQTVANLHNDYVEKLNAAANISVDSLNKQQNFVVGQLIYGDLSFRQPAIQEAKTYAMAGANVYMIFFDTDTTWDVFTIYSGMNYNAHYLQLLVILNEAKMFIIKSQIINFSKNCSFKVT